jgi:hypothetical protein
METLNAFPLYDMSANTRTLHFRLLIGGLKILFVETASLDLHHALIFTKFLAPLGQNIGIITRIVA